MLKRSKFLFFFSAGETSSRRDGGGKKIVSVVDYFLVGHSFSGKKLKRSILFKLEGDRSWCSVCSSGLSSSSQLRTGTGETSWATSSTQSHTPVLMAKRNNLCVCVYVRARSEELHSHNQI